MTLSRLLSLVLLAIALDVTETCRNFYIGGAAGRRLVQLHRRNGNILNEGRWRREAGTPPVVIRAMEWSFSQRQMYGLETRRNRPEQQLVIFNRFRREITNQIGLTGMTDLRGLSFDENNVLYAHSQRGRALYTIDISTGATTLLYSTRRNGILDMAYKRNSGALFATNGGAIFRFRIARQTSEFLGRITGLPQGVRIRAIAFTPRGGLFGVSSERPTRIFKLRHTRRNRQVRLQAPTTLNTFIWGGTLQCNLPPTQQPSEVPSGLPTRSAIPTAAPTKSPAPSLAPSKAPSKAPSAAPSKSPSAAPTSAPSKEPSAAPSPAPSLLPSSGPSSVPSSGPSAAPSPAPSAAPDMFPSAAPSPAPSSAPSMAPSPAPSKEPSKMPSSTPSRNPSAAPSWLPSAAPSSAPSKQPSSAPSLQPSSAPSKQPSSAPSLGPSSAPSLLPSSMPSWRPSSAPSLAPSSAPSWAPSARPSNLPTAAPSAAPSRSPAPSGMPSAAPL